MMGSKSPNGISFTKSKSFNDKLQHSLSVCLQFLSHCHETNIIRVSILQVINKALDDYHLEKIFLSFNGGKDCTVLLHLVHSLLKRRPDSQYSTILCIYLQPEQPFDEVESFVADCSINYFPIVIKPGLGTKQDALFRICDDYPDLKACLMGCRRTDPYCHELNDFEVRTN